MTAEFIFYLFAAVTVASALLVVLNRNAVYSAVLLVLCLFSLAVIFLLLELTFSPSLKSSSTRAQLWSFSFLLSCF